MDTSTDTIPPTGRRIRFAADSQSKPTANNNTDKAKIYLEAPTKLAESFIRRYLASLPPNHTKILDLAARNHVKKTY